MISGIIKNNGNYLGLNIANVNNTNHKGKLVVDYV